MLSVIRCFFVEVDMGILERIKDKARQNKRRIVLPEGESERTLRAADIILREDIADLILLGDLDVISNFEKENGLDLSKAIKIDPLNNKYKDSYTKKFFELRKHKGISMEDAKSYMEKDIYMGPMMIYMGDADGEVSGAEHTTADTVRPALQIVKTAPGLSVVSGAMIMVSDKVEFGDNGVLVFADVAIAPNPSAKELAEIAICSAETAKSVAGIEEPRVAMLSFSTKGSAKHEMADKVIEALRIIKERAPELNVDGELQVDAAIVESVGKTKSPNSTVAGIANVLVFPDLQSGNIGYKLTQRFGDVEAVGPILQGLGAPINDLSRGCSVDDIVNLVAITVNQCK
jgi:phosphate acetyltransferase